MCYILHQIKLRLINAFLFYRYRIRIPTIRVVNGLTVTEYMKDYLPGIKMSLCHIKKRYMIQEGFVEPAWDNYTYSKSYPPYRSPSPMMSTPSNPEEMQEFIDGTWQQQRRETEHLPTKRSSRTSSPQGQQVAKKVFVVFANYS